MNKNFYKIKKDPYLFFLSYIRIHTYGILIIIHELMPHELMPIYIYIDNEYFIERLSYYRTKKNYHYHYKDEINSEALFFLF